MRPLIPPGAVLGLATAALLVAGPLVDDYALSVLINILSYAVLATAWALFSGPTRYVSLATAAFFGTGAYTVAAVGETLGYGLSLACAAAVGGVLALVVGLATLRLRGMYFVIFSFGLTELIRELVIWWEFNISGTVGRYVFVDVEGLDILHALIAAFVVIVTAWLVKDRLRIGFALAVVGSDEVVARSLGINTVAVKLGVFVGTAVIMTLVGGILAPRWSYIDPGIAFNPNISFLTVIMALMGGTRSVAGPVLGVVPLVLLSDYLAASFPNAFLIVLGLVFLAIVYFIPEGLTGLFTRKAGAARAAATGGAA